VARRSCRRGSHVALLPAIGAKLPYGLPIRPPKRRGNALNQTGDELVLTNPREREPHPV